ncbi:MAG: hypothetical protein JNL99_06110 [Zoogloea sp.]|nr:hypothetical protein [Zoogloea sp.]
MDHFEELQMSTLTIKTGTEDDFQRGRQLARAADRGEVLPSESTISSDPDAGPGEGRDAAPHCKKDALFSAACKQCCAT